MNLNRHHIRLVALSIAASILMHTLILSVLGWFSPHNFTTPIQFDSLVNVDLNSSTLPAVSEQAKKQNHPSKPAFPDVDSYRHENTKLSAVAPDDVGKASVQGGVAKINTRSLPSDTVAPPTTMGELTSDDSDLSKTTPSAPILIRKDAALVVNPPLRTSGEFLTTDKEIITYRISLLGMPVGSATLEAKIENNEVRISLRVNSNPVVASIYPVEDLIETRHVGGNFILSKIRQQEGAFKSDRGFTIFLREKNVFWIDRLTNKSVRESIPNSDVVDILSGLYYLRNRPLTVGTTETLHIYDSDTYAAVPVEVLRREKITLPGFRKVDTLVIQPKLMTEGLFKRSGDVLIWVTDDEYRVPVRVETAIALGRVTAELVSAESQRSDRHGIQ